MLFGGWAEESARLVAQLEGGHELSGESIEQAIERVSERYLTLDREVTSRGVTMFFAENDPLYNQIKWNYSQNIYVAKVLGINQNNLALSLDIFQDAQFYFDTNLLIALLEPADLDHEAVETLALALQRFKSSARVCPITIEELENVITWQYDSFDREVELVPGELRSEVSSIFIQKYDLMVRSGLTPNRNEIFSNFDDPMRRLADQYGIVLVVDNWFNEQKDAHEVLRVAGLLEEHARTRGRLKKHRAALHDALFMLWVGRERRLQRRAWLVTADGSLLGSVAKRLDIPAQVITRESLLQWMSPLASVGSQVDSFANTFAQLMRERLLPQTQLFDVGDFRVLESLHLSIDQMPIDDVRGALNVVRVEGARLNLSTADDREKLQQHLAKYLVNPGRKYQQSLVRLEEQQSALKRSSETEREKAELERQRLETEIDATRLLAEEQSRSIATLKDEAKRERTKQVILDTANRRLLILGLGAIAYTIIVFLLVQRYGQGKNALQRVIESWVLFTSVVPLVVIMLWLYVGGDRLIVRWPRLGQFLRMSSKEND